MTTPEWISNTIWQFEIRRSITGLNVMLRTYGVVPWDAPVFVACGLGDAAEMQRLFDNRLASPFDRDADGCDLWQVSSGSTQVPDGLVDIATDGCYMFAGGIASGFCPNTTVRLAWPTRLVW